MANVNAPFGLKPVRNNDGSPWNQSANLYYIPSADTNAYLIGDTVVSAANGNALNGVSAVTLFGTRNAASTTGVPRGVVVGFGTDIATPGGPTPGGFDPNNLATVQIPATKTQNYYVYVADDPSIIFEAQADTIATTAYNKNVPLFVANVPTAPVNQSASYAQGSAAATTQALPLKVIGAPWRVDNDLTGTGAFAKVYVKFNQHELNGNTSGV